MTSNDRPMPSFRRMSPSTSRAPHVHANGHTLLPASPQNRPNGQLPNTPLAVSIISMLLGGLVFVPLALLVRSQIASGLQFTWARPQLGLYLAAMGIFHSLEFWTTAACNPAKLSIDSFLLNNGIAYHLAHLAGLLEYILTSYFFPQKFDTVFGSPRIIIPALIVIAAGQTLRSLAMVHASQSFSHIVKVIKHDDHTLITHGVYRFFRHPSYVGFFYWAIATQLLLGNVASTAMFVWTLGRFFYFRIMDEERHLVRFFGNDYIEYRKRVGTGLPFRIPVSKSV